jgi:hypothetical protein
MKTFLIRLVVLPIKIILFVPVMLIGVILIFMLCDEQAYYLVDWLFKLGE